MKSFSYKIKLIHLVFLLQALFCLVNTTVLDLNVNKEKPFNINGQQDYRLLVDEYTKKYILVQVNGESAKNNYVLSAYAAQMKVKRIQLSQCFNGVSKLYISKKQITNQQIFLELECSDYDSCSGTIKIKDFDKIPLNDGEPISYYITDNNRVMEFVLNSYSSISNVWARGQLEIQTDLKADEKIKNDKENYYIVKQTMTDVVFKVTGSVGDYINVGFIGYTKNIFNLPAGEDVYYQPNSNIYVDEYTITGYLKKGDLEKVCYSLELRNNYDETPTIVHGSGTIFSKIACSYSIYVNGTRTSNSEVVESDLLSQGIMHHSVYSSELKEVRICVNIPSEIFFPQYTELQEVVYTYQFISAGTNEKKLHIYEPQINGVFYSRIGSRFLKNAFIAHNSPQQTGPTQQVNYYMMELFGFPAMTVVKCDNYPLCSLDDQTLEKGTSPKTINRFSSLNLVEDLHGDISPISKTQTLLVVECKDIEGEQNFDIFCGYNTMIKKNEESIQLIEDVYFSQYSLEDEEYRFKIKLTGENNAQKVLIDVMTFVGDVEVIPEFPSSLQYNIRKAINKIYISVKGIPYNKVEELTFKVKGLSKTYYVVLFNIGRDEEVEFDSLITNELQSGIPYLVTIDPSKRDIYDIANKVVTFHNEKAIDDLAMMFNFYSLNCKIEVGQVYKDSDNNPTYQEAKKFDRFSHDFVERSDPRYAETFEYRINVTETEGTFFAGTLCQIYASAVEINTKHLNNLRDIILPDNTPQRVMFGEKLNHVSYGYVHVDFEYDLLLLFDLKHTAQYKIKLYYENKKRETEETIIANDVVFLSSTEWKDRCRDRSRPCYIQIDITLEQLKEEKNPVLELSIKSVPSKTVTYLPKSLMKNDYLQNDISQYYYTDLGIAQSGYIYINFLRGSGKIYARIVEEKQEAEIGANWRGKYTLPSNDQYLTMNPYKKKIYFDTTGKKCEFGCYLLINVFSDDKNEDPDFKKYYPFTINVVPNPHVLSKSIPIVTASIDEFIIGTIDIIDSSDNIYEIYQVFLTSDAEEVVIDFQSDSGGIFINVGEERPTISKAHFPFKPIGKDTIYHISKNEILAKTEGKKSLRGIALTIGVWANNTDSIDTTPYAFIVRLENGNENDIYRVNSDQKALCKTKKISNGDKYRCVYAIEYDYISKNNHLIVYPSVQTKSAFATIYGNYITQKDYEMNTNIKDLIPNESNAQFKSRELKLDLLYIQEGLTKGNYFLVSVETTIETVVELMSSLYIYNSEVSANPSTSQLFMVPNNEKFTLDFQSESTKMVMVNLRCIGGKAEIYWASDENNKYYLRGRDDRLSITSKLFDTENKLVIATPNPSSHDKGFFFYVNYDSRSDQRNFDKLTLDRSVNYIYNDLDLPIYYYAPLNTADLQSEEEYYDIIFSFNILEHYQRRNLTFYEQSPFEISAFIVKEKTVLDMKSNPELAMTSNIAANGIYDNSLRTGLIRIHKRLIRFNRLNDYDRPYLILKLEKREFFRRTRRYKRIGLEMGSIKSGARVTVSELSYQFGYLGRNETERKYRLRVHNRYKNMNIQFSCLEDALSIKIEGTSNELKLVENKYGKLYYSIENEPNKRHYDLIIKRKNEKDRGHEYFMFQYSHSNDNGLLYSIKNTTIKINRIGSDRERANFSIEFTPVTDYEKYDINYLIKFASKPDRIRKNPTKPFIATQNEIQAVKEYYNPKPVNNIFNFTITTLNRPFDYAQVIAQIKNQERVDYLSYDIFDLSKFMRRNGSNPSNQGSSNSKSNTLIIVVSVIGSLLLVIIIILVVIIFWNKKKYEGLEEKVNTISFAADQQKDEKDENLLYSKNA